MMLLPWWVFPILFLVGLAARVAWEAYNRHDVRREE